MHQIEISNQLYEQAKLGAMEAGFENVNENVAEIISDYVSFDISSAETMFTEQRLESIDKATAQIESGQFLTSKQADVELERRRAEWLQSNPTPR